MDGETERRWFLVAMYYYKGAMYYLDFIVYGEDNTEIRLKTVLNTTLVDIIAPNVCKLNY